jgi:N-acetylglucosaminyldiphosphoundecaprenol N-acetyl-beta-D-mannosaminyltransferase
MTVATQSPSATRPNDIDVMGVRVVPFASQAQAVRCAAQSVQSGAKSFWAAVNPQKIYRSWNDPRVRDVLAAADAGLIDGVGVSWASRLLTGWFLPRCTGCDLFFALLAEANRVGWRVFLLGASETSNREAVAALEKRFPDLCVAGRRNGYFDDDQAVIDQINASKPDLLFVAMGSPRQEFWIAEHREQIDATFFLGVGGSFDVAAGVSRRAPRAIRRVGLEFLYQLVTQPWRWKRQVVYIPFILRVIAESVSRRARHGSHRDTNNRNEGVNHERSS